MNLTTKQKRCIEMLKQGHGYKYIKAEFGTKSNNDICHIVSRIKRQTQTQSMFQLGYELAKRGL